MKKDTTVTIQIIKDSIKEFADERSWQQFHTVKNLSSNICVEAGELLELFSWLEEQEIQSQISQNPLYLERVHDEIADTLIAAIALCNKLDITISDCIENKLTKIKAKYPIEEVKGNLDKYMALKIKK